MTSLNSSQGIRTIILISMGEREGEETNLMNAILQNRKMVLSRVIKSVPEYLEVIQGK